MREPQNGRDMQVRLIDKKKDGEFAGKFVFGREECKGKGGECRKKAGSLKWPVEGPVCYEKIFKPTCRLERTILETVEKNAEKLIFSIPAWKGYNKSRL